MLCVLIEYQAVGFCFVFSWAYGQTTAFSLLIQCFHVIILDWSYHGIIFIRSLFLFVKLQLCLSVGMQPLLSIYLARKLTYRINSFVFYIGSKPNAVHHDINLDFPLKLLVFVLLGALLANRETKKTTPRNYQNKLNQSKFWCASAVHVSVNNQVCVCVCVCVCPCACVQKPMRRVHAQANTHHTHS